MFQRFSTIPGHSILHFRSERHQVSGLGQGVEDLLQLEYALLFLPQFGGAEVLLRESVDSLLPVLQALSILLEALWMQSSLRTESSMKRGDIHHMLQPDG